VPLQKLYHDRLIDRRLRRRSMLNRRFWIRGDADTKADLDAVNTSVNRRIEERSDLVTAGSADDWRLPTKQGDCEDIAILKKSELLKRGWPASALLLTVASLGGEGHTVLTVRTDKGDLILDNRGSVIRDWSHTSYHYFARQSQSASGKWVRISS
jgi:predicted transglutaminase-like cysteine proteinase